MPSGYCYEYLGRRCWRAASSERWPVEMYTPTGKEVRVGRRRIDDVECIVFRCPDGKFRAVTRVSCAA